MKKLLILIVCTTMLISAQSDKITIKSDQDAIVYLGGELSNIRGMLEMYAQLGCRITYKLPNPKEKLKALLVEFDSLMDALDVKYSNDTLILDTTKEARNFWSPVKSVIVKALAQDMDTDLIKAKTIYIHNNIRSTIKNISKMKAHLVKTSKIKYAEEINAVLEIGASARRLSAHYMMRTLNVDDPTIEKHYKKGLSIYKSSLALLTASTFSKDAKVAEYLKFFKKRLLYFEYIWQVKALTPVLMSKWSYDVYKKTNELAKFIK